MVFRHPPVQHVPQPQMVGPGIGGKGKPLADATNSHVAVC